jgi:hypothetical protein
MPLAASISTALMITPAILRIPAISTTLKTSITASAPAFKKKSFI